MANPHLNIDPDNGEVIYLTGNQEYAIYYLGSDVQVQRQGNRNKNLVHTLSKGDKSRFLFYIYKTHSDGNWLDFENIGRWFE